MGRRRMVYLYLIRFIISGDIYFFLFLYVVEWCDLCGVDIGVDCYCGGFGVVDYFLYYGRIVINFVYYCVI